MAYSHQQIQRVIDLMKTGLSITEIIALTGISRQSVTRWIERHQNDGNWPRESGAARPAKASPVATHEVKQEERSDSGGQVKESKPVGTRGVSLSKSDRLDIIKLYKAGYSVSEIIQEVGVCRKTVIRWINRYETTGTTNPKPRYRRIAIVSDEDYKATKAATCEPVMVEDHLVPQGSEHSLPNKVLSAKQLLYKALKKRHIHKQKRILHQKKRRQQKQKYQKMQGQQQQWPQQQQIQKQQKWQQQQQQHELFHTDYDFEESDPLDINDVRIVSVGEAPWMKNVEEGEMMESTGDVDDIIVKEEPPELPPTIPTLVIPNQTSNNDEFHQFGQFLASQLRAMPLQTALKAQLVVQEVLMSMRL